MVCDVEARLLPSATLIMSVLSFHSRVKSSSLRCFDNGAPKKKTALLDGFFFELGVR